MDIVFNIMAYLSVVFSGLLFLATFTSVAEDVPGRVYKIIRFFCLFIIASAFFMIFKLPAMQEPLDLSLESMSIFYKWTTKSIFIFLATAVVAEIKLDSQSVWIEESQESI